MIVFEVMAYDECGAPVHQAQFLRKENAKKHFKECLEEYASVTPPYEIEDDGEFAEDDN